VLIHELEGNRDVRNLYMNIADKMRNGRIRVFTQMSKTRRSLLSIEGVGHHSLKTPPNTNCVNFSLRPK